MTFKFNPTTTKLDLVQGTNPLDVGAIQFDISHTPLTSAPGLIQWNSVDGTYDMGLLNSSVLQVGQETMFYGKASGAISNGDVCQFAGVQGDHILIKKAVGSEIEANPHYLVGIATEPIANGTFGYVTWFGKINGIYTKTPANQDSADWVAGDILYFNITTGQLTKTMPSVPNRVITVAAVIKLQTGSAENGIIIVRPTFGQKLEDLDDVNGTALTTNGQMIRWNETNSYFDFDPQIRSTDTETQIGSSTNYTNFDASGHQTMIGTATVWDDLLGDVTGVKVSGTGVSVNGTESTLEFLTSANTADYAFFNYQLSHKWKNGSVIEPHIHFEQTSSGMPNWLIQYRWQRQGQPKTTAWTNYKCTTPAFTYTSGTLNQIAEGAGITPPTGYNQVSDIVEMRLIRDTTNTSTLFTGADTYTGIASVTSMDCHYEMDSLGSNSEYTK